VLERYGVEPGQVPDFIALRGDPSDKLPGAKGIGPKGAAKLLRQHGTLEQALEAGELAVQADELRLYRRIATMDGAAPLPPLPDQTPIWTTAADLACLGAEPPGRASRCAGAICTMSAAGKTIPLWAAVVTCWRRRMSWRWHRPGTGSSCIRRCAAGRRGGVAKKIAEQSIKPARLMRPRHASPKRAR
jgi:hypothetical protein